MPNVTSSAVSPAVPDSEGWFCLRSLPTVYSLRPLTRHAHLPKLAIDTPRLLTSEACARLHVLPPVECLHVVATITRRAMRHLLRLPGLELLDVMRMVGPGRMSGWGGAITLHTLRMSYGTESDLFAIAECASLREIALQHAEVTPRALDALLRLPLLSALDLEGTAFDDRMAEVVAACTQLERLDLGATRLTASGLAHLQRMPALRSLDVWSTAIDEAALACLPEFPALEFLSLGSAWGEPSLDADRIVPVLLDMPHLKRLWLDGVVIDQAQKERLDARLEWTCFM